jgi:predicted O-methyltransferase YrrM
MFWKKQQAVDGPSPNELLSPLPQPFRSALVSMYNGEPQVGADGERHSLEPKTRIPQEEGMWMYRQCREAKPKATLEIGLAYGFSTVYFLAAISENGVGHHTAVDPFQKYAHGIGQRHTQSLGMSDRFRLIEEKSVSALLHLAEREEVFELIFIDGSHRFDDVLMDFTLAAELCPMGGNVILDDLWMPSVRRAVAFIRSNRSDFEEIKTQVWNIAQFRRIGKDARDWHHGGYVEFSDSNETLAAIRRFTPAFVRRWVKAIVRSVRP